MTVVTPKVLLVNDDAASVLALESLLTSAHEYEIVTAHSGREALRQVLIHEFAVILLDVSMPEMDGFETAEAIHSHPRSASTPIIFVTAYYADEITRLKGYQKGAVDYLFTPVIPQILQSKVAVFVELAKKRLELEQKTQQLEALAQDLRIQRLQDLERINAALEEEIVERRQAEQRAHELATRDPLTRLANRRSFIERLEYLVAHAGRRNERLALLFLDLDKFKSVNDTLGHEVGDQLLIQIADRLNAAVRATDMVARLGGDELVVLLEALADSTDATRIAKKIAYAIAEPYHIGPHKVTTSASIGISVYPQDGASAQELMKNADLAMYHAKQQKRGSIQFFHEEINAKMLERVQFEQELRLAIEREEFELHYQPKVEIASGRVVGVEALLRWRHPRLGLIATAEFIAAATESQLLVPLGEWVISTACAQARRWLDAGLETVPIAVNVNMQQLQADLPVIIGNMLRKYDIPSSCLQLEITESLLILDLEKAASVLQQISDSGVLIAVEDFGTGYTPPSLLKTLPIGILKIDQSFVRNLEEDAEDAAIVSALIAMARALALRVVAEGVESEKQLAMLKSMGCDEYQGYLFSEPMPPDELLQRLLESRHTNANFA